MRTIFLLALLMTNSVCFGQSDQEEFTCQDMLYAAGATTAKSIEAAEKEDWNTAFHYDDQAFTALMMALVSCEDNPELMATTRVYIEDHQQISQRMVCSFHALAAHDYLKQGKRAFDVLGDYEEALFSTEWGIYHLDEATSRCDFDTEKVTMLREMKGMSIHLRDLIKEQIIMSEMFNDGH